MIAIGDAIPSVQLRRVGEGGLVEVDTADVFKGRNSVLFGIPGCYTPTCSLQHLPSFLRNADAFRARSIDQLVCMAVNDPFVMHQWLKDFKADGHILGLPDGNAAFTRALGLEMDGSSYGLGTRVQRFSMVVRNGVVNMLNVEKPGSFDVSSGESILQMLAA